MSDGEPRGIGRRIYEKLHPRVSEMGELKPGVKLIFQPVTFGTEKLQKSVYTKYEEDWSQFGATEFEVTTKDGRVVKAETLNDQVNKGLVMGGLMERDLGSAGKTVDPSFALNRGSTIEVLKVVIDPDRERGRDVAFCTVKPAGVEFQVGGKLSERGYQTVPLEQVATFKERGNDGEESIISLEVFLRAHPIRIKQEDLPNFRRA